MIVVLLFLFNINNKKYSSSNNIPLKICVYKRHSFKYMKILTLILSLFLLFSCKNEVLNSKSAFLKDSLKNKAFKIYTVKSKIENQYAGFNSPKAINRIADIENEYFNFYKVFFSKYYGTMWYESSKFEFILNKELSDFEYYKQELAKNNKKPDSMHCTIYAVEALKAGLEDNFLKPDRLHKKIWKDREYAGWSVGYILTKYFNRKAYLIINEYSDEYQRCFRNYNKTRIYDVWKQPDIKLEKIFHPLKDSSQILKILKENEFAWGFSDQGLHTWITRFDMLKECNWSGAPSFKFYGGSEKPLFISTKFTEFYDYNTHIIIFPPKND